MNDAPTISIAFYKAWQSSATWVDKIIAIFSFGRYSHVEIVFSDGACFSVSPRDKSARFKTIDLNRNRWELVRVYCTQNNEKKLREYCEREEGIGYDYIGAIFSITPLCVQRATKVFCSELVTNLGNNAGIWWLHDGCKYSPSSLHKALTKTPILD